MPCQIDIPRTPTACTLIYNLNKNANTGRFFLRDFVKERPLA